MPRGGSAAQARAAAGRATAAQRAAAVARVQKRLTETVDTGKRAMNMKSQAEFYRSLSTPKASPRQPKPQMQPPRQVAQKRKRATQRKPRSPRI